MKTLTLDTQKHFEGLAFPLIIDGRDDAGDTASACRYVSNHRRDLLGLLDRHGAILFRDFGLHDVDDFDAFIQSFELPNFQYRDSLSNAVRVNKTERVFTANEAPPDVEIFMHHEMAQTPVYPSRLFFFCEKPAERAGATPVCRSDRLWERMQEDMPEFAAACETHGLYYTNVMPDTDDPTSGQGRSWRSTFFADSRDTAERRMRELGYTWEWLDDGSLRATTPRLQAVRTLDDGSKSFFNQLIASFRGWKDARNDPSKSIHLGNGEPLDTDMVMRVCDLADEFTVDIPWQAGDVALVDNYRVMHGRRPFEGSRKVLASLVAA